MIVTCPHCGNETAIPDVFDCTLKRKDGILFALLTCDWCESEFEVEVDVDIIAYEVPTRTQQAKEKNNE